MKSLYIHYEQHIISPELGFLHVVSGENITDPKIVETLLEAAKILYHQYGAGRLGEDGKTEGTLMVIQYFDQISPDFKESVSCEETESGVYLADPLEGIEFFQDKPEQSADILLMSDPLHIKFHNLLRDSNELQFDDVIKETFEQEGLFCAIVVKEVISHDA